MQENYCAEQESAYTSSDSRVFYYIGTRTMKRMQAKETIIQAMRHHENGELDEAEKLYRKAIADEIYDKRVFVNLAAILRETRKTRRSRKSSK